MKLSFVIPCYGSEFTIEAVITEIDEVMAQKPEFSYEIICVNDCSPDNVLIVLKNIVSSNTQVTVVDLTRNMGKHAAVMAGYSLVSGDVIINLDDDGQCPIPNLWELIEPLRNGFDVSVASYPIRKQSKFKNIGTNTKNLMDRVLVGMPKGIIFTNFSAVNRLIINEVLRYKNPYPYVNGLLLRATQKVAQVTMEQRNRVEGNSHFTFRKSFSLWMDGFTAFSVKPLRIATFLGFLVAIAGFAAGLFIIIKKLFITPNMALGYPSLITVILFIGGSIMLMLGMLGEYIGRIYISINSSPQYVIREIIGDNRNTPSYLS